MMLKKFVAIFILLLAIGSVEISACGGFFCRNVPIDQSAERIIFTVNGDGTLTAIVGINYTGAAEDFSWVVPVPSPPTLDVAETQSLDRLQLATDVQFTSPPNHCEGFLYTNGGFGGGGEGDFLEEGHVGPYDYAIIGKDDVNELISWLRDNGYQVTEDMEPIMAQYVDEGMLFLAMKLSQDAEVGDIQPIVMTYESERPMIPIRLTAVAAVPNMPVITWIFADTQYVPENYAHPTPDFSAFNAPSQLISLQGYSDPLASMFANSTHPDYPRELGRIQEEYKGLAFVTEYAQPTSELAQILPPDVEPYIGELIARFPYVTRLRAQMSPEQMTLDPIFIPKDGAPNISNRIDLADHVDPLHYWGCSTRLMFVNGYSFSRQSIRLIEPDFMQYLPPYHSRIKELHLGLAHPKDWQVSDLTDYSQGDKSHYLFILAPEAVTRADVDAFLAGEKTVPMLMISYPEFEYDEYANFKSALGIDFIPKQMPVKDRIENTIPNWDYFAIRRPDIYSAEYDDPVIFMSYLVDIQEWEANQELYTRMLYFADTFQYYSHADLQHTLFYDELWVGFPSDWIEATATDGLPIITPEGIEDTYLKLHSVENFLPGREVYLTDELNQAVTEAYGIEDVTAFDECQSIVAFEHNGRKGFVQIINQQLIIESSAPSAVFDNYEEALFVMAASVDHLFARCEG